MSDNVVVLPVQLDILRLEKPITVAGPLLDFTKLPWDGSPSHKEHPYLSETIAAESFEDQHTLQPGLHYHWNLPLALTKTSTIGIVYRQSFHSVFGTATHATSDMHGDDIWNELIDMRWLRVIDERIGMAVTDLPSEREQHSLLQQRCPKYSYAILRLLSTSVFPPVPNRWLLSRSADGTVYTRTYIESDYIWDKGFEPPGISMSDHFTVYPRITDKPDQQPYDYLGRSYEIGTEPPGQQPARYLDVPLTAAGYGEPAFAAFYPICRSVFGHHDPHLTLSDHATMSPDAAQHLPLDGREQYELIGWYDDPDQDYFRLFVHAFKATWQRDHQTDAQIGIHAQHQQENYLYLDLLDAIHRILRIELPIVVPNDELMSIGVEDDAGQQTAWEYLQNHLWLDGQGQLLPKAYRKTTVVGEPFQAQAGDIKRILNEAIATQMPDRLICYARCDGSGHEGALPVPDTVKIALGNSSTEALSALLASEICMPRKDLIEDQLEAIQFASVLQHTTVDTGPIFEAMRHEKQFRPESGGRRWRIKVKTEATKQASQLTDKEDVTLPMAVANELNLLNTIVRDQEQNGAAIHSLRRQIYADWCWYLKFESALRHIRSAPDFDAVQQPFAFGTHPDERHLLARRQGPQFGTQIGQEAETSTSTASSRTHNNSYERIAREFLAGFKTMIRNEIRGELRKLENEETRLTKAGSKQQATVQAALFRCQDEQQFVQPGDVLNWDAFRAAVANHATALNVPKDILRDSSPASYLATINAILARRQGVLPWSPNAEASWEYQSLRQLLTAKRLPPGVGASIRLRANRLALESHVSDTLKHRPALELTTEAASRFWRPNDPVMLISGFDASPRHQDVRHTLKAHLVADVGELHSANIDEIIRLQDLISSIHPEERMRAQDWHPLFLAWDVGFSQAHRVRDEQYSPRYIQDHYRLGNNEIEPREGASTYDPPMPFYGRTLLTPGASVSLKQTIVNRLVPLIYQQFADEKGVSVSGQPATIELFNAWLEAINTGEARPLDTFLKDDPDLPDEQQIKQWLTDELSLQNDIDSLLSQHLLNSLRSDSHHPIIKEFFDGHPEDNLLGSLVPFLDWAQPRTHLKAQYVALHQTQLTTPLDLAIVEQDEVQSGFVAYLKDILGTSLQRYYVEMNIPVEQQLTFVDDHYNELIRWYQTQVAEALHMVVEVRAYQALLDIRGLAQAMTGFGDALIMRHQAFQLPVSNPFPHDGDNAFTSAVRTAVQTANAVAPGENFPFSPWRAGKIALSGLELLDNFGRYWPNDDAGRRADPADYMVHSSDTMRDVGAVPGKEFAIAPRLAQNMRLAFTWLAAHDDIEEMNEHPASNPICGWIMPNFLDESLMIYAPDGNVLGYINVQAHWTTFPGNIGPILPADIDNSHLAQMVQWLCAQGTAFLSDFLAILRGAQENMEPESYAQHESLAFLIGHPLALVRADARLRLKEPPAINVSQLQVQADVQAYHSHITAGTQGPPPARNTFDFEHVQVPLRLGEFRRLNDGLAGYWLEGADGQYADNIFYAPQTAPIPGIGPRIKTRHQANSEDRDETDFLVSLSPMDSAPRTFSLLLDPRAPIHATTGVLPVHALYIPPIHYVKALQRMEIAFLTAPVLAPEVGMELSLPSEPGFDWTWVQQDGQQWSSMSAQGLIRKHQVEAVFGPGAGSLWQVLIQQGWLEAVNDTTARMVPEDKRTQAVFPLEYAALQDAVELLFNRLRIRPFNPMAQFDTRQHIREGWLRLSPSDSAMNEQ